MDGVPNTAKSRNILSELELTPPDEEPSELSIHDVWKLQLIEKGENILLFTAVKALHL